MLKKIAVFATFFLCVCVFGNAPEVKRISVLDFGAKGDGITDDTAAIQRALDAARGEEGTRDKEKNDFADCGKGRSVFSIYFPNRPGGFYKITDTLVVDGTYGVTLYGDGALASRGDEKAVLRWYGKTSKPVIQIKGMCDSKSNPNFQIAIRDLTITGYPENIGGREKVPENIALAGIYIGNMADVKAENTLTRNMLIENVKIVNCRFGIWSGNPHDKNTDHAHFTVIGCGVSRCAQAGVFWGTGNAIVSMVSNHISGNGWVAYPKDGYSPSVGANVHVVGGYVDLISYTSGGDPTHADIYQSAGRIAVTNAWSDTSNYFLYQAYASQNKGGFHNTHLTGIRQYRADAVFEKRTVNSMRLIAPGMVVSGCLLYGNIEVVSGFSGRPVFAGINFIRKDAGFVGTGVEKQRSLVVAGNAGNYGQILIGGANKGVPLKHKGSKVPAILNMGDNPVVFQALGAGASDTGVSFMTRTDDANGDQSFLINGTVDSDGRIVPLQETKMVWRISLGGVRGLSVAGYDPRGKKEPFSQAQLKQFGGWRGGVFDGYRDEVLFAPPQRTAPPVFSSGDFWEGCIYYDKNAKTIKLNVGGKEWVDLRK